MDSFCLFYGFFIVFYSVIHRCSFHCHFPLRSTAVQLRQFHQCRFICLSFLCPWIFIFSFNFLYLVFCSCYVLLFFSISITSCHSGVFVIWSIQLVSSSFLLLLFCFVCVCVRVCFGCLSSNIFYNNFTEAHLKCLG